MTTPPKTTSGADAAEVHDSRDSHAPRPPRPSRAPAPRRRKPSSPRPSAGAPHRGAPGPLGLLYRLPAQGRRAEERADPLGEAAVDPRTAREPPVVARASPAGLRGHQRLEGERLLRYLTIELVLKNAGHAQTGDSACSASSTPHARRYSRAAMPAISVAIIAKDEAERLQACVDSCRPFADEVLVVDSGSTDGTLDLARRLGCAVVEPAGRDTGLSATSPRRARRTTGSSGSTPTKSSAATSPRASVGLEGGGGEGPAASPSNVSGTSSAAGSSARRSG